MSPPRFELRILLTYGVLGVLWIFFSAYFLPLLPTGPISPAQFHIYIDTLLLLLGTLLLYLLLRRHNKARTQAEEQLRLHVAALEAATNAIVIKESAIATANAVAMAGLDGNLTYVNPAFLKLWGYAHESEVLGKASVDFWDVREQAEEIVTALHNEGNWNGELTAQHKDGTHFPVQISASMVLDKDSQPLCMQAWFLDITERKERERELETISAISAALRPAITRAEVVPAIFDQLLVLLAVDGALLETLDLTNGNAIVEMGRGIWAPVTGRLSQLGMV